MMAHAAMVAAARHKFMSGGRNALSRKQRAAEDQRAKEQSLLKAFEAAQKARAKPVAPLVNGTKTKRATGAIAMSKQRGLWT